MKNSGKYFLGENSHLLLHLNLVEDGEYNNATLHNTRWQKICENVIDIPSLVTTRGEVFKIHAHKKSVMGGTFTIRNLEDRQIYSAGPESNS